MCVCPDISQASHIPSHLGYQPCNPHTQPSILVHCCAVQAGFFAKPCKKNKIKSFISFFIPSNSSSVLSLSSTCIHLHSAPLSVSMYPSDSDICLAGASRRDAVNTAKSVNLCKSSLYCFLLTSSSKWGEITQLVAKAAAQILLHR